LDFILAYYIGNFKVFYKPEALQSEVDASKASTKKNQLVETGGDVISLYEEAEEEMEAGGKSKLTAIPKEARNQILI
jgi:hypothetical protein